MSLPRADLANIKQLMEATVSAALEEQDKRLEKRLEDMESHMDKKLEVLEERMDERFDTVLDAVGTRFDQNEEQAEDHEVRIVRLEKRAA